MNLNNTSIVIIPIKELLNKNIKKPDIQRIIDRSKVNDIINFQLDFYKKYEYFNYSASGPINIHVFEDEYYLIDGQHRLESIEILYNKYSHNINVYVMFVHVNSNQELENNYMMINKNTTLPDFSCFENIDKKIPEQVAFNIQTEHPDVWSKSIRARRPHVYFNYFQEALAFICEKLKINNSSDLQELIINFNKTCFDYPIEHYTNVNETMYEQAKEKNFCLGLYSYENEDYRFYWAKKIVEDKTGIVIKKKNLIKRKGKIPKKLKNESWDKYIGKNIASVYCICCKSVIINAKEFTAGHIISEFNGGKVEISNIMPICSGCNSSMGTKNMDEYIKEHYSKNYVNFKNKTYKSEDKKNSWGIF